MKRVSVALGGVLLLALIGACDDDDSSPVVPPVNVRPDAITDLVANVFEQQVSLAWTAPADGEPSARSAAAPAAVTAYEIRHASSRMTDETWEAATSVAPPAPGAPGRPEAAVIDSLEPGSYFFAIRSMDADSAWSALSNQPSVTVQSFDGTAPAQIQDLAAGLETATTVRLTWAAPTDTLGSVASYLGRTARVPITNAVWETAQPLAEPPAPLPPGTPQTWVVGGFTEPGLHFFALRAIDSSGNVSQTSNVASVNVRPDLTPPQAVGDLAVAAGGGDSVVVAWTATGDDGLSGRAASYEIRWSTSEITPSNWDEATIAPDPPVPAPSGQHEFYTFRQLPSDTVVWMGLRAADQAGNVSALSNVVFARTDPESEPPARIVDLRATDLTSESVFLLWTAPGDDGNEGRAARYDLRRAPVPIDPSRFDTYESIPVGTPEPSGFTESLLLEGLTEGALYLAIRAADEVGNLGEVSNILRIDVPADNLPPDPIVDLAVVSTEPAQVSLTWTAPADRGPSGQADRYELRYSTSPLNDANWDLATSAAGLPTPSPSGSREDFVLTGLEASTTYFIGIRSWDAANNESPLSNIATARTESASSLLVRPDGTGDYPTIQAALDAAPSGATIELDDGVFRGPGNKNLVFPAVPISLRSLSRDPERCTIDCEAGGSDEVVAISSASPLVPGTLLDGITFRGGRSQNGAAIQLEDSDASIHQCRFVANRVPATQNPGAGAIELTRSRLDLVDCVFTGNVGEPLVLDAASQLTGLRCAFLGDSSAYSSGVHSLGGTIRLTGCELKGGIAADSPTPSSGAAVFAVGGDVELRNCLLHDFGVSYFRSPIWLESAATARVYDTSFRAVGADYGDGVFHVEGGSELVVERCAFIDILASYNAGAGFPGLITCQGSSVEIRDCMVDRMFTWSFLIEGVVGRFVDSAVQIEDTIFLGTESNEGNHGPGLDFTGESDVVLRGCTFVEPGGTVWAGPDMPIVRFVGRSLTVDRCIFSGNSRGSAIETYYGLLTITCTDIFGNYLTVNDEQVPRNWPDWMGDLVGVDGNIEADPRFCEPETDDYRLQPDSPCAPGQECDLKGALAVGCE